MSPTNPNAHLEFTGRALPRVHLRIPDSHARYYRIHVQDDGYPAQRLESGATYEHPLYPTYLINEYLAQYSASGDRDALAAAKLVADAALRRMRKFQGALVFWYPADGQHARIARRHYSALTQAYYVRCFFQLSLALGEPAYEAAAREAFASLLIPVDEGGVARRMPFGMGIEELPLDTPDLILNGWLSALATLCEDGRLVDRMGASEFIEANLDALEHLLPKYDCPEYRNSRYSLAGPLYLRLRVQTSKSPIVISDAAFALSDAAVLPLAEQSSTRWSNFFFEKDVRAREGSETFFSGRNARFNVIASHFATPNRMLFTLQRPLFGRVLLEGYIGEYDPLSSAPVGGRWIALNSVWMCGLPRQCDLSLPPSALQLVGYPTNFAKVLDGQNRNIYHETHIRRLEQITAYQNRPLFRFYANKWRDYTREWPSDPRYAQFGHDPDRTDLLMAG